LANRPSLHAGPALGRAVENQQVLDPPVQHLVTLEADRVEIPLGFQRLVQVGDGERRITPEESADVHLAIAGDNPVS